MSNYQAVNYCLNFQSSRPHPYYGSIKYMSWFDRCFTKLLSFTDERKRQPQTQLLLYSATEAIEVLKSVKSSLASQMSSQYIPSCQHYAGPHYWKQWIRHITVAGCPKIHSEATIVGLMLVQVQVFLLLHRAQLGSNGRSGCTVAWLWC